MRDYKKYIVVFLLGFIAFYLLRNKPKNIEGLDNNPNSTSTDSTSTDPISPDDMAMRSLEERGLKTNVQQDHGSGFNIHTTNGPIRMTIVGNFNSGKIQSSSGLDQSPLYILNSLKDHLVTHPEISNDIQIELRGLEEIYKDTVSIDFIIHGISNEINIPEVLRGNVKYSINDTSDILRLSMSDGYYLLGNNIEIDYGTSGFVYKWENFDMNATSIADISNSSPDIYCNKYDASDNNMSASGILETDYEVQSQQDCRDKNFTVNIRTYDTTKNVYAPCVDHNPYCSEWVTEDLCEISQYMQENCKRSCNICPRPEQVQILPPDVTRKLKRDHDKELNMDWRDIRYLQKDNYVRFSERTDNTEINKVYQSDNYNEDWFTDENRTDNSPSPFLEMLQGVPTGKICDPDMNNYIEEKFPDNKYDELKEENSVCFKECYAMEDACRSFSVNKMNDDESDNRCRFYQNCDPGNRKLYDEFQINSNPQGKEFTYYFKPGLDPIMGNSLAQQIVTDELRLSEDELNSERIIPARYQKFNLTPGTANTFQKFDETQQNKLNDISFQGYNVHGVDTNNRSFYKCSPGTSTSLDDNEKICVNTDNSFQFSHLVPNSNNMYKLIQSDHIGHDNDKKSIVYAETELNNTLQYKSDHQNILNNIDANNLNLFNNFTTHDELVFSSISPFKRYSQKDGNTLSNPYCNDSFLIDSDVSGLYTFNSCKDRCRELDDCKAFSYHDLTGVNSSENKMCRLYNTNCTDKTSGGFLSINAAGQYSISANDFFSLNNVPDIKDALPYMFDDSTSQEVLQHLVGNYHVLSDTNITGNKLKDLSGKNNDARLNGSVVREKVEINPTTKNLLMNDDPGDNSNILRTGGLKNDIFVIKGNTDHESKTRVNNSDVAYIDFPQTLTANNYTIFYITRWAPDYDKESIDDIRFNKPWTDSTTGQNRPPVPPNTSTQDLIDADGGFAMNKNRILTSSTSDWFSGHYGGAPLCTGTIGSGSYWGSRNASGSGHSCYQTYGITGSGNDNISKNMKYRSEQWCANGGGGGCTWKLNSDGRPEKGISETPITGMSEIRLGVAKHDGSRFLNQNAGPHNHGPKGLLATSAGVGSNTPYSGTDDSDHSIEVNQSDDVVSNKVKNMTPAVATEYMRNYKNKLCSFILGTDTENHYNSNHTQYASNSGRDRNSFKISINKPSDANQHEITQHWELAEIIIFDKELNLDQKKRIRSYLYYKYYNLSGGNVDTSSTTSNYAWAFPSLNIKDNFEIFDISDENEKNNFLNVGAHAQTLSDQSDLQFSQEGQESPLGNSTLYVKVNKDETGNFPADSRGINKYTIGSNDSSSFYTDKSIKKVTAVKQSTDSDNHLYSLDELGNVYICNPNTD